MLWDEPHLGSNALSPVRAGALRVGLVWGGGLPRNVADAAGLARLDLLPVQALDGLLAAVARVRPDVVVLVGAGRSSAAGDIAAAIAAARTTESLPVLLIAGSDRDMPPLDRLSPGCGIAEAFLVIRSLLRRQRPLALSGTRRAGRLTLDEARFQLECGGHSVALSKTDLCLLGPFFDLPGAVFDRAGLERLAFGVRNRRAGGRAVDAAVSRTRRALRDRIGFDPIQAIRGQGYRLGAE